MSKVLIRACDRLLKTETEVLAMDSVSCRWFMSTPGHRDCFMVARALKKLLQGTQQHGKSTQDEAKPKDLNSSTAEKKETA